MRNSDLLSDCLVDSDADATRRAQQRRRNALTISLVVEFILVAALLAGPLLNPSTMSARFAVVPVPPFPGGGHRAAHPSNPHLPPPIISDGTPVFPVPGAHPRPAPESDAGDEAPSIGDGRGGVRVGPDIGPGIFGSPGNGPAPPRLPETTVDKRQVTIVNSIQEAKLVVRIQPVYPLLARQAHISGTVELRAIIAANGSVMHLEVISGNALLARAAVEAVKQWRYRPTVLNGQPVEVQTFITVKFTLE
ncbi:MAG: TonB family protein [Candidatus Acidiferrales bacterium]